MVTTMTRRALAGSVLLGALAVPLAATPASAASYTSLTIAGEGLPTPLELRGDADPELFAAMVSQVAWLHGRPGQTTAPAAAKRGPKYTVVLSIKDVPKQSYELYPLAVGGPRVYRSAKQPDRRKTTAGWFFGRLNMSETMRIAGVPLPVQADALMGGVGGGIGGGDAEDQSEQAVFAPMDEVNAMLEQWRRLFLLNGAVALLIAAGLAGVSLLIRPKS